MDFNPFPQLEAALYRRNDEQPSSPLECHNHILQGSYLRYIKRSLRPKDIGSYRLKLVQGTLRGRLQSIRLHPGSVITAITGPGDSSDLKYEIHITGTDDCKIRTILGSQEVKWQISFPSEEVQQRWLVNLRVACNFAVNWHKKDEIDRLKDLARKMRSNVDARMRFHRFKLFSRCFVGRRAIRWIVKYEGCTPSEACIVGQKMLNLGLFQHITNEHVFCNKKLLYQFPSSFDHLTAPRDSGLFPQTQTSPRPSVAVKGASEEEKEAERALSRTLSMNANELVQELHMSNQQLEVAQSSLGTLQVNISSLEDLVDLSVKNKRSILINQLKNDYVMAIFQTLLLITFLSSQFPEYYMMTRFFLFASVIVAFVGTYVLQRGFYAIVMLGEPSRDLRDGLEGENLKSVVDQMATALKSSSSKRAETRTRILESLYAYPDDYDLGASDMDDEEVEENEADDSDDDSDDDKEENEGEEEEEIGDDDDDDDADEDDDECDDEDEDAISDGGATGEQGEGEEKKEEEERAASTSGISFVLPPVTADGSDGAAKPLLWPNYPLLLKRSRSMLPAGTAPQDVKRLLSPLHIHQAGEPEMSEFAVESDLFIGKAFIIVADLQDSPHAYFKRKERKFEAVFQGRFKKAVPFGSVYTGQAYDKAIQHIPAKFLVNAALKIMSRLQPAIQVALQGDKPYFLSPLASTAQKMIISYPGEEPSISYGIDSLEEDISLLDPSLPKMTSQKRKSYFVKRENLNGYTFSTDLVYTFDFYQHRLNLSTFKVDLGFVKYDLRKMLLSRPIQMMAVEWCPSDCKKTKESDQDNAINETPEWKFLYNIEIWHKRCVRKGAKTVSNGSEKINNNNNNVRRSDASSPRSPKLFEPNSMPAFKTFVDTMHSTRRSSGSNMTLPPPATSFSPLMMPGLRTRSKSISSTQSSPVVSPHSPHPHTADLTVFEPESDEDKKVSPRHPPQNPKARSGSGDMTLKSFNIFNSNNRSENKIFPAAIKTNNYSPPEGSRGPASPNPGSPTLLGFGGIGTGSFRSPPRGPTIANLFRSNSDRTASRTGES